MGILNQLFSGNEREIAKLRKTVDKINAFEPQLEALSDTKLKAKTDEFKSRLAAGETLDDILPEAFAVVREAGKRTVGMRHFDVQMIGGMVLYQGRIAEMKTGEGKTLVATLPMYLVALEGRGAHLVTTNDFLAKYHAQWMGPIYNFLGLSVGALQGSSVETGAHEASFVFDPEYRNEDEPVYLNLRPSTKQEAYQADITYGTNHVFGFDYLRDNMTFSKNDLAQRELHFAIVDEVDSILIDEARVPLIISGATGKSTELYHVMDRIARGLVIEEDYTIDEKSHTATFTDEGLHKVERALGTDNLSEDNELMHHASVAIKAYGLYKRDINYVIRGDKVVIVDEFTGRLMFGRRYGEGLHQALEAKEGIKPEAESQTLATITFQNYFRLYDKLSGMTGTALTEEEEFRKIYGLDVVVVPTNMPMIRMDNPDTIFKTEEAKLRGLTIEILKLHSKGQPVLVGTRSVEMSERLSGRLTAERLQLLSAVFVLRSIMDESKEIDGKKRPEYQKLLNSKFDELTLARLSPLARELHASLDMLKSEHIRRLADMMDVTNPAEIKKLGECLAGGIKHNVLNAKYHEREAEIIAEAGRLNTVTIATNMAGRGVDIILGGKPQGSTADRNPEAEEVIGCGGLAILGSERHESRRIDNQLRGRAGRQGDPGLSRFFVSLEDELWRVFGDKTNSPLLSGWQEDLAMDSKILSKMIERTQKKMEEHYFAARKNVLKYDDVMNKQREVIYGQRRQVLEGADLKATVIEYLHRMVEDNVNMYCPESLPPTEWDPESLYVALNASMPLSLYAKQEDLKGRKRDEMKDMLVEIADRAYNDKEKELGTDIMRDLERHIALRAINDKWMEHLDAMDYLREGIGLRAYAQVDPVMAYQNEAFDMFQQMLQNIQDEIAGSVFRAQLKVAEEPKRMPVGDVRMSGGEYKPIDFSDSQDAGPMPESPQQAASGQTPVHNKEKVGRNDPCPCGSGKKYKKCCLKS